MQIPFCSPSTFQPPVAQRHPSHHRKQRVDGFRCRPKECINTHQCSICVSFSFPASYFDIVTRTCWDDCNIDSIIFIYLFTHSSVAAVEMRGHSQRGSVIPPWGAAPVLEGCSGALPQPSGTLINGWPRRPLTPTQRSLRLL